MKPSGVCSVAAGRLRADKKRSRQTSCLLEDCSLRARKVLRDHVAPYHGRISQARVAAKLVALVSLVHLVSLVYLVQPNKRDKPNKPEQPIRSLSQKLVAMVSGEILVGTKGDDSSRIDVVVSDVVVPLDVVEVHGVGDAVGLIEVFEVAEEVGIVDDPPEVALEMAMVDGVEAYEGDEQAPIGFDEL